jgi:hypothetical protein
LSQRKQFFVDQMAGKRGTDIFTPDYLLIALGLIDVQLDSRVTSVGSKPSNFDEQEWQPQSAMCD